jgi:hypothetical protein
MLWKVLCFAYYQTNTTLWQIYWIPKKQKPLLKRLSKTALLLKKELSYEIIHVNPDCLLGLFSSAPGAIHLRPSAPI